MTISAVITTFNRREFLREALASLRSQTRLPDEIVIVDDGSTDGTREEMTAEAGVRYLWKPNGGTSSARNEGWMQAQSEWIAFLDSDDLWEEKKLEWQEAYLEQNSGIEAVFGHACNFASPGTEALFQKEEHHLERSLPAWLPSAALVRRSLLDRTGGFDPKIQNTEAVAWILQLRQAQARMSMLPQVVLRRRLHEGNKQHQSKIRQQEHLLLIRRWIEHRRSQNQEKISDIPPPFLSE